MKSGLAAVLAALLVAGCAMDRHEVAYEGYFDAKAQDAIKRAWVPEWLPEETTDIREVHAGDSGRAVLRATLPVDAGLPDDCRPTTAPPAPPLRADWFPEDVTARAEVHRCDDGSYVVLDGAVLYRWTTGDPDVESPGATSLPSEA